jgi:hypothetical protein
MKPEKSGKQDISLKQLTAVFGATSKKLQQFVGFFIFLILAALYAFVIVRISQYSNPVVTDNEVTSKVAASPTPKIDQDAANKLKSLEDNSVNVQTLFDQGRINPFGE